ncbi:uncharacterized protein LOC116257018 [Nymphaea colorata]|nr:uncharacterized protein LOC116257018 [Nymphaea colorata]XP_031489466.1 uncharacterized protein LOC116257018 [Nymphaea colorata]XP_031489467.1 uncharacterized protein LOC116257018 [Nymphaea colorata]
MASASTASEIDLLDRHLLSDSISLDNDGDSDEVVLFRASFQEMEENFVKYQTFLWVLYSLALILACGIGLIMLLYLPVRRRVVRRDFQSRKLYVTPTAIVYKVTKPMFFPFLGALKREKHILLPSVANVVVEQGYLQSFFGIYYIRIENLGVRRPASDDVHIQGIMNPKGFKKGIMTLLSSIRDESFRRQLSVNDDCPGSMPGYSPRASIARRLTFQPVSPSRSLFHKSHRPYGEQLLHKLDEIGSSVKKVQSLVEERFQEIEVQT